jgi:hypothetical protein
MSNPITGGWFGIMSHVLHVLRVVGADTDEQGQFLVRGTIATFMGLAGENADVVVGPDAQYRYRDQWCGLASAMNATSYGLRNVGVI